MCTSVRLAGSLPAVTNSGRNSLPLLARAWRERREGTRWFVHAELLLAANGA